MVAVFASGCGQYPGNGPRDQRHSRIMEYPLLFASEQQRLEDPGSADAKTSDCGSLRGQSPGVKLPSIYPPLQALTNCGILQSKKEHKLGSFWRSDEILHAIDHFAERAGRNRQVQFEASRAQPTGGSIRQQFLKSGTQTHMDARPVCAPGAEDLAMGRDAAARTSACPPYSAGAWSSPAQCWT